MLVASPEPMATREALAFTGAWSRTACRMAGFVVNRVHPDRPLAGPADPARIARELSARPEVAELGLQPGTLRIATESLLAAHADLQALAASDRGAVNQVRSAAGPGGHVALVPLLDRDVHDIDNLARLGRYLFD